MMILMVVEHLEWMERRVGDLVSNYYDEVVFWWPVEHRKRETGEFSK